jgi:hypothetical protein
MLKIGAKGGIMKKLSSLEKIVLKKLRKSKRASWMAA